MRKSLTNASPLLRRIIAILLILVAATGAWAILASTIFYRTYELHHNLRDSVAAAWGGVHKQQPPSVSYSKPSSHEEVSETDGKKTVKTIHETVAVNLPIERSRIDVGFDLDHRQKGLLWYSTYGVTFKGNYVIRNTSPKAESVLFSAQFPANNAIYDDLQITVNGKSQPFENDKQSAFCSTEMAPGQTAVIGLSYKSHGLDSWQYNFGGEVNQIHDFLMTMHTNFRDVDFPEGTLSPTTKNKVPKGWDLTWQYNNLVTGFQIGLTMPDKLQPGPLAGTISYFAPVSLLFFFFWMFILTTIRGIPLHPMNYFFLAAAFFSFHLLLAYMVDHMSIHVSFAICSVISIFLVISYLRLVVGTRFAAVEAGLAQFIYLVLFSYAFFFKGFTGLAIAIGAVISLFVVMQLTGRIDWEKQFAAKDELPPSV